MNIQTSAKPQSTLLRWREADTPHGITKETAMRAAKQLGLNETQLIHEALATCPGRYRNTILRSTPLRPQT